MANNPDKPKDNGKIKLPPTDSAMNKVAPTAVGGGKGENRRRKKVKPPVSAKAGDDEPKTDADPKTAKEDDPQKPLPDTETEELLARIRKRMDRCIQSEADNRKAALEDLKFKAGDQWPADVMAQRNFDRRPCLTINKLPTFVHQITNEQRQNRPTINVNPVGDKGDLEAAKTHRGLIRAIERHSSADIAYDTAFDNAVSNGFGYWRIVTEFEAADSFNQVICIKRIRNPFTVYLDPDRQEPDGADARFGFVTEMIPRSEFEEQYPDKDPMPFSQGGIGESMKNWVDKDRVRIAEYFEIKHEMRTLVALSNGHVGWKDELAEETKDFIDRQQITVLREREAEVSKVKWYKVTARQVLESRDWPGKWIPIVECIGDEIDIEGKVKKMGVIRNAKDAQRMYNYWKTSETELIALAPKAPWIMEEGQVEGHESTWKQANVRSNPYLLYKAVNVGGKPAPPPQRQQFAGVPAGVVQAAQGAAQDMMATTGIRFDASMNERMIDESGKAIHELRRTGDIGSFHYVDNLARSLRHTGRILIDLIPKVYDKKRVLTILREDDTEERIQVDPDSPKPLIEQKNPQTGKTLKIFNPTYGDYGVTVTIGPSYATKRIEAAQSMMDFARAMPNVAALVADLIAKNQDWPGAGEMATRLAKAVPPQFLSPDQKDVPPQVQALIQALDQQVKLLTAERMQLMKALNDKAADRAQRQDEIDKTFEAKLIGIVQKAEANFNTHVGAQLKELGENVTLLMRSMEQNSLAQAAETAHEKATTPPPGMGGAAAGGSTPAPTPPVVNGGAT